jgi:hypothetical protein
MKFDIRAKMSEHIKFLSLVHTEYPTDVDCDNAQTVLGRDYV